MSRPLQPILDAAEVERIICAGLPMSAYAQLVVTEVKPGSATIRIPFRDWMIRPGGTVAGPVLMLAADSAMYAVILAHIGDQVMAVTSSLTINFLSRPRPVDVIAEGRILKLGRRLAVVEVLIKSDGDDSLVAHVTGSYALPS